MADILALVTDAFGGRGGIAQYNRDFLKALTGCRQVSSIAVLPRVALDPVMPPAGINQMWPRPSLLYIGAAVWAALIRRIDIVFCGHLHMAPLAILVARWRCAKLVVQMHGVEAWAKPTWLRRRAVEAADLVLCVSRHTRACVLTWAAIAPERVLVLPNTVSEMFTPGDGLPLRKRLGLEGKFVLLSVGRVDARERYKGHDRVIAAIAPIVTKGHDIIYLVVGEGDDLGRLKAMAEEAGVGDRVRFVGAADRDTLIDIYRMADLFVLPSTGEGFGIVFLEAMASGVPVLGLAVAGACDALADGELGTAVSESEFPAILESAIKRLRPNPHVLAAAVRARFGRNAFNTAVYGIVNRLRDAA